MKSQNKLFFGVFVLALLLITFGIPQVNATTGGEVLIYDFKYNGADESVYYTKQDGSGRGCPPMLEKVSLNTEKSSIVFSCDQGEKMPFDQVKSEIDKITKNFKLLTPLNLEKNNIAFDITFSKVETYGADSSEILMRRFMVEVYQNNKKIKEFPITGCSIGQPFIFQGYSIPGFDKKITVLVSAKGNCAEGGYVDESLYVVGGVDNLDKTPSGDITKGSRALLPREGNLVVYESQEISSVGTTNVSTTSVPVEAPIKKSFFQRLIEWLKNLF